MPCRDYCALRCIIFFAPFQYTGKSIGEFIVVQLTNHLSFFENCTISAVQNESDKFINYERLLQLLSKSYTSQITN